MKRLAHLIAQDVGPSFEFGGYRFMRAASQEDAEEAYALRHRLFVEEGLLDPDSYPSGLFRDRFDEASEQILVRDGDGRLVATTRFVKPSLLGFPTEHLFDFERPTISRKRLGEYGRLAIEYNHRGRGRAPMLGMLKAVFECMLENQTTHVYAFLTPQLAAIYAGLGCVSIPLRTRPPSASTLENRRFMRRYFERQEVAPVLFDLRMMLRAVGVQTSRKELDYVDAAESAAVPADPAIRQLA